jgi:hypothetical protein
MAISASFMKILKSCSKLVWCFEIFPNNYIDVLVILFIFFSFSILNIFWQIDNPEIFQSGIQWKLFNDSLLEIIYISYP